MEKHTAAVLSYIKYYIDTVVVVKRIRIYPNQKPWMSKEVQHLLCDRNRAFRSGDGTKYNVARASLKRGIRHVWQGVQQITNYKPNNIHSIDGDTLMAEELNHFFARFEVKPSEAAVPLPLNHCRSSLTMEEWEVRNILRTVDPRKVAGPDIIPGRMLKDCADKLTGVFTKIFNRSLSQSTIPS